MIDRTQTDAALRMPPQNLDAERGLLGSLFFLNEAIDEIDIRPEEYYADAHRTIQRAIDLLWLDGCRAIDVITVAEKLRQLNQLEEVGGLTYLWKLAEEVPHAANARYYEGIVKKKAKARHGIHAMTAAIQKLYSGADADETLTEVSSQVDRITSTGVREFATMADACDALTESRNNPTHVGRTGLPDLDFRLRGGIRQTQTVVIAGRPGSGKSVLSSQIAATFAARGETSLIVSLEMDKAEIAERFEMTRRYQSLRSLPVLFDETAFSAKRIAARIRHAHRRHGIKLAVLDYLQLVEPDDKKANRERQVADVSRAMKLLAKEIRIPIILACQLNREPTKDNRKPRLSDLRESGAIEQDADIVLMLHEDDEGAHSLIVAKQRGGPTGDVPVTFLKDRSLFTSRATADPFGG